MNGALTNEMIGREALVMLANARRTGMPMYRYASKSFTLWNGESFGNQQYGVWFFPDRDWRSQSLNQLSETMAPMIGALALSMPKELAAPVKALENPKGVEYTCIETYGELQIRTISAWFPIDGKDAPFASWFEIMDHYNVEIDFMERRACCLALRFDVTRTP